MDQSHEANFKAEHNPLPFYTSPPSLQQLASKQIAALLWRHRIHNADSDASEIITESWLENQHFNICDLLGVPFVIGDAIDEFINLYRDRLIDWGQNLFEDFIIHSFHDLIVKCVDYIEYDDDIIIRRKIFEGNELIIEEKYEIACNYCWEKDIQRLWPLVSNNKCIIEFPSDIVSYWNDKMKGKTPLKSPYFILSHIIPSPYPTHWSVIEFFFDQLNPEERSSIVAKLLEFCNEKTAISILPKLNKIEVNLALDVIGCDVLPQLAKNILNYDYVLRIWKYLCDVGSIQQIYDALNSLWWEAYQTSSYSESRDPHYLVSGILHELWMQTPLTLRREFLAENPVENIFNKLNSASWGKFCDNYVYGRDMSFMLEILKTEELPKMNEIWRKNWRKLIIRAAPEELEQFMKMCFDCDQEIIRFKESVMMDYDQLESEFEWFVKFQYFSELIDYVKFCSSNQQCVENLMRRIVDLYHPLPSSCYAEFDSFDFKMFSNAEYVKEFKSRVCGLV